ncbi:MAG: molybdopterin molybdotransferase MoeA [Muricomes sp.]
MQETLQEKTLIPKRDEMVSIIQKTLKPVRRTESIPFYSASGRVCAEDVFSSNILPNYLSSRFDGITVRYADFENGPPDTSRWTPGEEYAYGNTGIAMPDGYDTLIAIEDVTIRAIGIEIHKQPEYRGQMVNPVGENMQKGERLIAKGTVVTPAHVGLFAAGGILQVNVYARPRIGIIPTGNELVPPTPSVPLRKNVDSNSYMIAAYLSDWGAEPTSYPIAPDDPPAIAAAVQKALAENDAAIIIAGSSLGTKDYTIRVMHKLGDVVVPELAHGPGRKSSLSVIGGKPVLGIAGPPLGAQITCDLYLSPFVSALRGLPHVKMQTLEVICDDAFISHGVDFCERVHIYRAPDGYHARASFSPKTTRAQMQALSQGNFYRAAGTQCEPGERTTVELLCPVEYLPDHDEMNEILGKDVQPYE